MKALLAAAMLLACVPAASAATATVTLDTIAIDYDPARWEVTATPAGALFFRCHAADCRPGRDGIAPGVSVRRSQTGAPSPEEIAAWGERRIAAPLWETFASTRTFGGVVFTGYAAESPCRAYVPSMLNAIGTVGDRHFAFSTGFNAGCVGRQGVGQQRLEALLQGVRAVEDGAN